MVQLNWAPEEYICFRCFNLKPHWVSDRFLTAQPGSFELKVKLHFREVSKVVVQRIFYMQFSFECMLFVVSRKMIEMFGQRVFLIFCSFPATERKKGKRAEFHKSGFCEIFIPVTHLCCTYRDGLKVTRGQWPFRSAGKRVMIRMASNIGVFAKC